MISKRDSRVIKVIAEEYEFVPGEENWFVWYNVQDETWDMSYDRYSVIFGCVYMKRDNALKILEALND